MMRSIWLLPLLMTFSLQSFAKIEETSFGYKIETCNSSFGKDSKYELSFTNSYGQSVTQGGRTDSRNCIIYSFNDGTINELSPGTEISYVVYGSDNITIKSQGKEITPLPSVDMQSVVNAAAEVSHYIVREVLRNYGPIAQEVTNIQKGWHKAMSEMPLSEARNLSLYKKAYQDALAKGETDGLNAGTLRGQSDGSTKGQGEAYTRFVQAVDNGQPSNEVVAPEVHSEGLTPNVNPVTMQSYISTQRELLAKKLKKEFSEFYQWDLGFDTAVIFGSETTVKKINFTWNGQWAFEAFLGSKLKGDYYDFAQEYLSLPRRFSDGDNAQKRYKSTFISEYNAFYDYGFSDYTKDSYGDQKYGRERYQEAYDKYVEDLGKLEGYTAAYVEASKKAYIEAYAKAYVDGFNKKFSEMNNNVVITDFQVQVLGENGSQLLYPGSKLQLVLTNVVNAGGQSGLATVSISSVDTNGTHLIENTQTKSVEVKALSKTKEAVTLNEMATISFNVNTNREFSIKVSIGNQERVTPVKISFAETIKSLAKFEYGSEGYALLVHHLSKQLKMEYDYINDTHNLADHYKDYEAGEPYTLLEQMVFVYKTLDAQVLNEAKTSFVEAARSIRAEAYPEEISCGFWGSLTCVAVRPLRIDILEQINMQFEELYKTLQIQN